MGVTAGRRIAQRAKALRMSSCALFSCGVVCVTLARDTEKFSRIDED